MMALLPKPLALVLAASLLLAVRAEKRLPVLGSRGASITEHLSIGPKR